MAHRDQGLGESRCQAKGKTVGGNEAAIGYNSNARRLEGPELVLCEG